MTKGLGNIHGLLQHDDTEGYTGNPTDEADDAKDTEEGENDGRRVVMAVEVVDACPDSESNVQDTGDPDKLLRKSSGGGEIGP